MKEPYQPPIIEEPAVHLVGSEDPGGEGAVRQRAHEVEKKLARGEDYEREILATEDEDDDELEPTADAEVADPLKEFLSEGDHDALEEREAEEVDVGEQAEDGEEVGERGEEEGEEDEGEGEEEEEGEGEEEEVDEEEEEGEEEDEEEEEGVFVAKLPGRNPNDPDIEIEMEGLGDEEREAFQRLRNGYMRREQLRVERDAFQEKEAVVNETIIALQTDPLNFVMDELKADMKADLARHLLSEQDVYEAVRDEIANWDADDSMRERDQAKLALKRREAADAALRQRAAYQEAVESARMVAGVLDVLIPEGFTETEAQAFHDAATYDLERHVNSTKTNRLTKEDVIRVLNKTGALRRYGIDPSDAERRVAALDATSPDSPRKARVKRPSSEVSREEKARNTGKEFKRRSARRKNAASSGPPGAGSSAARLRPPKGQGVKERADWYLKNMRRG